MVINTATQLEAEQINFYIKNTNKKGQNYRRKYKIVAENMRY